MLIVAGITRSGLSLTMQMLHAGGYQCQGTPPDFEPFPVGTIPWDRCRDTAVKLVDAQLQLPPDGDYKIIRLRRDMTEQARSMNKWAAALFRMPAIPVSALIGSFRRDYEIIDDWCSRHTTMVMDFEKLVTEPGRAAAELTAFANQDLDVAMMVKVVIPRTAECYPELLELKLIENADSRGWFEPLTKQ